MTTEAFIEKIPFATKAQPIAYLDCGLIAIEKSAGIMSHPNPSKPDKNQVAILRARYNLDEEYFSWQDKESGEKMRLHLINRLDSPTSGVLLAATNEELAKAVKKAFKGKTVEKTYYAICLGRIPQKEGIWSDELMVKKGNSFVRAEVSKNHNPISAKRAITKFNLVKTDSNGLQLMMLKLCPITGRTHQLRIQCAKRRNFIVGDANYGDFKMNKSLKNTTGFSRLFLHCADIRLDFDFEGTHYKFSANSPIPEEFEQILTPNGILSISKQISNKI